jgi:glycosyltransferase involved in cell wall biosynthesis
MKYVQRFRISEGKPNYWGFEMVNRFSSEDVSVVVCTRNSISGIEACLESLRESNIGELIVVDAHSTDGTADIAFRIADKFFQDPGLGLGNARNIGISQTTKSLILNWGSDNVLPIGQLDRMIHYLVSGEYHGVSAQTLIKGDDYLSKGLNTWRSGRFFEGAREIIGTPTLFYGEILRKHPYDSTRVFSDDSELCERWKKEFNAQFAISDAVVEEVGKTSWNEIQTRARMYGSSDKEVFDQGLKSGWNLSRIVKSLLHPLNADFITPIRKSKLEESIPAIPFLLAFTASRYAAWTAAAVKRD